MKKIIFDEFSISDRRIDFHVLENLGGVIDEEYGYFEFNVDNRPTSDAICYALTAMIRSYYDEVYYDLPVHCDTLKNMEDFASTKIICKEVYPGKYICSRGGDIALNFSGGFDSLAAYALLPVEKTKLIAMDFGGGFVREKNFFQGFDPYTVSTNFRQMKFFRKLEAINWTFMGVGSFLYQEKLRLGYIVFGSVLEASAYGFSNRGVRGCYTKPFSYMGMKSIFVTNGLTEIGTALVASKFEPSLIKESLNSLADDGSEKKFRKYIILKCLNERFSLQLDLSSKVAPQKEDRRIRWGAYLASDFLLLYFIKHMGHDFADVIMRGIPEEVFSLVSKLKLDFYEKISPNYLSSISDDEVRESYLKKLKEASVESYDMEDVFEFHAVRRLLSRYHKGLADYCVEARKYIDDVTSKALLQWLNMARIDIKNYGENNDVKISVLEGTNSTIRQASWFSEGGKGYVLETSDKHLILDLECHGTGRLMLRLMGIDRRTLEDERLPLLVDYTRLIVNDEVIFEGMKSQWHDEQYTVNQQVCDGEKIRVEVSWSEHGYTGESLLNLATLWANR